MAWWSFVEFMKKSVTWLLLVHKPMPLQWFPWALDHLPIEPWGCYHREIATDVHQNLAPHTQHWLWTEQREPATKCHFVGCHSRFFTVHAIIIFLACLLFQVESLCNMCALNAHFGKPNVNLPGSFPASINAPELGLLSATTWWLRLGSYPFATTATPKGHELGPSLLPQPLQPDDPETDLNLGCLTLDNIPGCWQPRQQCQTRGIFEPFLVHFNLSVHKSTSHLNITFYCPLPFC